ncbi:MAG: hypothetical protein ACRCXT_22070, partial [Paraclostridium sp.]
MSDNILDPLVDSIFSCWKVIQNNFNKITGYKKVDFEQLFINTKLYICEGEEKQYPKEKHVSKEDEFSTKYLFSVPVGITVEDFEKRREKFAHLLNVNNNDLRFSRIG